MIMNMDTARTLLAQLLCVLGQPGVCVGPPLHYSHGPATTSSGHPATNPSETVAQHAWLLMHEPHHITVCRLHGLTDGTAPAVPLESSTSLHTACSTGARMHTCGSRAAQCSVRQHSTHSAAQCGTAEQPRLRGETQDQHVLQSAQSGKHACGRDCTAVCVSTLKFSLAMVQSEVQPCAQHSLAQDAVGLLGQLPVACRD